MQAFQQLVDALRLILKDDPNVVDVTSSLCGFNIVVADEASAARMKARHPRYRGMPVLVTIGTPAQRLSFLGARVWPVGEAAEVRVCSGVFMAVSIRDDEGVWNTKLHLLSPATPATPLGAIVLPPQESARQALAAAEMAAMSYADLATAATQPVRR